MPVNFHKKKNPIITVTEHTPAPSPDYLSKTRQVFNYSKVIYMLSLIYSRSMFKRLILCPRHYTDGDSDKASVVVLIPMEGNTF